MPSPDSSDSSIMQNRKFPFQKSSYQGSPPLNYMQLQANTMQFMPRFGYADNPSQTQLGGQTIGFTESTPNVSPINQQPMERTPSFCGYMSLPILSFPSISDALQPSFFRRSSVDRMMDSPSGEPRKLFQKNGNIISQDSGNRNIMDSFKVVDLSLSLLSFLAFVNNTRLLS